jgi:hypothetical protein
MKNYYVRVDDDEEMTLSYFNVVENNVSQSYGRDAYGLYAFVKAGSKAEALSKARSLLRSKRELKGIYRIIYGE